MSTISHGLAMLKNLVAFSLKSRYSFNRFSSSAGSNQFVKITFINKDGDQIEVPDAEVGKSILQIAHDNNVDLEGACEGSLACSTCHVILDSKSYAKCGEPSDEENDMLDLAFGLTQTSRLGCQIKLKPELDGITVTLPSATRNIAVDGYKPPKH